MRVKDSLERGVSYFYAEVQRIKAVLDAAERGAGAGAVPARRDAAGHQHARAADRLAGGAAAAAATPGHAARSPRTTCRSPSWRTSPATCGTCTSATRGGREDGVRLPAAQGVVDTTNALRVLRMAGVRHGDRGHPRSRQPPAETPVSYFLGAAGLAAALASSLAPPFTVMVLAVMVYSTVTLAPGLSSRPSPAHPPCGQSRTSPCPSSR